MLKSWAHFLFNFFILKLKVPFLSFEYKQYPPPPHWCSDAALLIYVAHVFPFYVPAGSSSNTSQQTEPEKAQQSDPRLPASSSSVPPPSPGQTNHGPAPPPAKPTPAAAAKRLSYSKKSKSSSDSSSRVQSDQVISGVFTVTFLPDVMGGRGRGGGNCVTGYADQKRIRTGKKVLARVESQVWLKGL